MKKLYPILLFMLACMAAGCGKASNAEDLLKNASKKTEYVNEQARVSVRGSYSYRGEDGSVFRYEMDAAVQEAGTHSYMSGNVTMTDMDYESTDTVQTWVAAGKEAKPSVYAVVTGEVNGFIMERNISEKEFIISLLDPEIYSQLEKADSPDDNTIKIEGLLDAQKALGLMKQSVSASDLFYRTSSVAPAYLGGDYVVEFYFNKDGQEIRQLRILGTGLMTGTVKIAQFELSLIFDPEAEKPDEKSITPSEEIIQGVPYYNGDYTQFLDQLNELPEFESTPDGQPVNMGVVPEDMQDDHNDFNVSETEEVTETEVPTETGFSTEEPTENE